MKTLLYFCALGVALLAGCGPEKWPPASPPDDFRFELQVTSISDAGQARYATVVTRDSIHLYEQFRGYESGFATEMPARVADSLYLLLNAAGFTEIVTPNPPEAYGVHPGTTADYYILTLTANGRTHRVYQHINPITGVGQVSLDQFNAYSECIEALMQTLRPIIAQQAQRVPVVVRTQVLGQEHDVALRLNAYDMLPHQHLTLSEPMEFTDTISAMPGTLLLRAELQVEHETRAQAEGVLQVRPGRATRIVLEASADSIRLIVE